MGVLDKFLSIMKLDEDDYDDDDFMDDDEEFDDYDDKSKKNAFGKKDSIEEEEDYSDSHSKSSRMSNNKVTPMRPTARKSAPSMEVCVIKPNSVDNSRDITETLLDGRTVILNLEGLGISRDLQRIIHIDFTSGAAFAISGKSSESPIIFSL